MKKQCFGIIGAGFLLVQCGGGASETGAQSLSATHLQISVAKQKAQSTHPLAQVQHYRVTVSGRDGVLRAMEFAGDATKGQIDDLPADADVTVRIEADNSNAQVILRGTADAVRVQGGTTTEVPVTLATVPIFTNLRDGAIVVGSRVRPAVLAAPGATVRVVQAGGAAPQADLIDLSVGRSDVAASAEGVAHIVPAPLAAGAYRLRVEDTATGEASEVAVQVLADAQAKPAALFSSVGSRAAPLSVHRTGSYGDQSPHRGVPWPLQRISNKK